MPSRKKKKAKGKARGAAKGRKELNNDGGTTDVETVELRMQRLQINNDGKNDEDVLLEEAINLAAAQRKQIEAQRKKIEVAAKNDEDNKIQRCNHGFVPLPRVHVCSRFIQAFLREFSASRRNNDIQRFMDAHKATLRYDGVWRDQGNLEYVISYFVAKGADAILEEKDDIIARQSAVHAIGFENFRDTMIGNDPRVIRNCSNFTESSTGSCDEHTLVSIFRKRTPCKCLDKRYKEVKSIVKMGTCDNLSCPRPGGKTERSKLMKCEQCRMVDYCSIECQKAAWASHKKYCNALDEIPVQTKFH